MIALIADHGWKVNSIQRSNFKLSQYVLTLRVLCDVSLATSFKQVGEFRAYGKHSVLHADIHVPFMVRHPAMAPPPQVRSSSNRPTLEPEKEAYSPLSCIPHEPLTPVLERYQAELPS